MTRDRTVLVGHSLFDGERLTKGPVAIELIAGRVATVNQGETHSLATDPDAIRFPAGHCLVPGFVDAHVHLLWDGSADPMAALRRAAADAVARGVRDRTEAMLRAGITACRDVGGPRAMLEPVQQPDPEEPEGPATAVFASYEPLTAPGGHLHELGRPVSSAREASQAVEDHVAAGATLIKLMVTGGIYGVDETPHDVQLSPDVIGAAVKTAHAHGLLVAAHAQGDDGIRIAVDAGVDTIEHGIFASSDTLARMADQGTVLVPTLAVMDRIATSEASPPYARAKARQVLGRHRRAVEGAIHRGIRIAVGTDMWSPLTGVDAYADEVGRLGELGLTGPDLLAAATSVAADCIRRDTSVGRLVPGATADIAVVAGELDNVAALPDVERVYRAGVEADVGPA